MVVCPDTYNCGSGFTVICFDAVLEQPFSSVTSTVYVELTAGDTVMAAVFCPEFQWNVPALDMAVNVTSSSLQISLKERMLTVGMGFTSTVAEVVAVQP